MNLIEHQDLLHVRDLASFALALGDNYNDAVDSYDKENQEDIRETFESLISMLAECGQHVDFGDGKETGGDICDALMKLNHHNVGLFIAESYFTQAIRKETERSHPEMAFLPDYVVTDWEATANNLKFDYTTVNLAGESYLIRLW